MTGPRGEKWTEVSITGLASVVVQGMLLLPVGTPAVSRVVVKSANGRIKMLPAGERADQGAAAVLPGDLLALFGGVDAKITYRPATWRDILRFKPIVKVQLLVATLTLLATVLASISAFVGTRSPTTPSFTADAAPWVLGIACVLAISNVYSSIKTDLS
ncbi:MAG: hypothetical protein ACHQFZ_02195 [Acidimicrobiales bacterium]